MDFTFLNRAFSSLSETTMEKMNAVLTDYAITEEMISSEKQRMDTTVPDRFLIAVGQFSYPVSLSQYD